MKVNIKTTDDVQRLPDDSLAGKREYEGGGYIVYADNVASAHELRSGGVEVILHGGGEYRYEDAELLSAEEE